MTRPQYTAHPIREGLNMLFVICHGMSAAQRLASAARGPLRAASKQEAVVVLLVPIT